ncbi:MAG: EamA family transporter [Betaproteobacteria bacterium HGW-Betaproteobacteria-1]|jgi:drug/metabolite transporter (DMT)-like permease|nr:MAG: EamA family transporter [Betaproteobacteria bacterium HGW-Betaproteobacteria-1]
MYNFQVRIFLSRFQFAGVVLALISAVGFSAKAIFVKLAYGYAVDAVTLLALRMAFSVPFFLVAALYAGSRPTGQSLLFKDWVSVAALGFIGYYLASFLDFLGLKFISAGLERLILFLYPTMVVLISALVFRKKVGKKTMLALLVSYAGIAMVFLHDVRMEQDGILPGSVLVFSSALAYAIYLVGAGNTIVKVGATRFTAYAMTVACVAALLQFVLTHPIAELKQPFEVYGLSFAMAIFSTVLPAFTLGAAIRRIGSMHTSMIGAIGPVVTIYLAYLFLGELLSATQLAGSVLVVTGVLMISLKSQKD